MFRIFFSFFYKLSFEIKQTEVPFSSTGVFSKRRKEDLMRSKQHRKPWTDFVALSTISQCWGPERASSLLPLPLLGSAWQLSPLKRRVLGVWEDVSIRQAERLHREEMSQELWPGGDEEHRAVCMPSETCSLCLRPSLPMWSLEKLVMGDQVCVWQHGTFCFHSICQYLHHSFMSSSFLLLFSHEWISGKISEWFRVK